MPTGNGRPADEREARSAGNVTETEGEQAQLDSATVAVVRAGGAQEALSTPLNELRTALTVLGEEMLNAVEAFSRIEALAVACARTLDEITGKTP